MKNVLVFRTSVNTSRAAHLLRPVLDGLMGHGETWNFDLEDCDRILRVEATTLQATTVIRHLKRAGFWCEELED
ncbi:hypothetical protein C8N40_10673 [Pontibacter mucosus]|uniref:Uncharacterized protein n=1 Tax=Pontibacter mucosus TaxID=1649266 RepID=A0A2T5YG60_9BACT|nr:hypothetical protein [Pontibacter mucosus]PTX18274.1 hypothetical protein C8N40_10673 [Pontibacter mucosus]